MVFVLIRIVLLDHLLRDSGACVRTCPMNKKAENHECVPCDGPCPKSMYKCKIVAQGFLKIYLSYCNTAKFLLCKIQFLNIILSSRSVPEFSYYSFLQIFQTNCWYL